MKIVKTVTINKPAQFVWKIIAHDFDQAHRWMSPIPHSYGIGKGEHSSGAPMEGRICHLSNNPQGAKAKEMITHYSDSAREIEFEVTPINNPAVVPIKRNLVRMTVKEMGLNQTEVTWVAQPQLKTFAYLLYPLLRLALPIAFGKLLQGLQEYAEGSAFPTSSIASNQA